MTLLGSDAPLSQEYDVALVDLDGVTYRGPRAIPEAPPAIAAARADGMRMMFVTNNASRSADEVAIHLTEVGIAATRAEVMTAAQAAAEVLTGRLSSGARVLVVGGSGLRDEVLAKGFTVVDSAADGPVAVVQGWHPEVGWKQLAEAAYAVQAGAYYLATNRDLTLPTDRGMAPGNGSLVRAVVTASGVEPESAGKPEPGMFLLAARRAGARAPLVVGDRLDTDLGGGRAAGYPGLLVLTGVSTLRDAILAPREERPSFIGGSIAALGDRHPAPFQVDGWWHVGTARARVIDGSVDVGSSVSGVQTAEPRLDVGRAACAAAWAAADEGEPIHVESVMSLGLQ